MKKKHLPITVGKTTEGVPVLSGAFHMVDSQGLPLEDVMLTYLKHGNVVAVDEFYQTAIAAGWKPRTVIGQIREAMSVVYGLEGVTSFEGWLEEQLKREDKK